MITPIFELNQDDDFLTVCIKVPYAKVSDTDIYFNDYDFKFYCKPYFLRLNLPGQVIYSEDPSVTYEVDEGKFTIKMVKMVPGEHFEGLDFLTRFLAKKSQLGTTVPKIEVLGETTSESFDDIDWEIEQPITNPESDDYFVPSTAKCGFANMYSCCAFKLKEETSEVFDITSPEKKTIAMRTKERIEAEAESFSEDHYLADLYNSEEIQHLIDYRAEWDDLCESNVQFTLEEKDQMRKLPNKEYLLEEHDVKSLLLNLVDILYAYCYNKRTTEGENTVESGWTINKLSATMCWLETFSSAKSVVKSCFRRSLSYPLYRHWDLSVQVLNDTIKVLSLGNKYIVKCLLEIHSLFNQSDPHYLLNDLYITDFCVWVQSKSCCSKNLQQLAKALNKICLTKGDIGLDLVELEQGAILAISEQNGDSKNLISECLPNHSTLDNHLLQIEEASLSSTIENLSIDSGVNGTPGCSTSTKLIQSVVNDTSDHSSNSESVSDSDSLSGTMSDCAESSDSESTSSIDSSSDNCDYNLLTRNQSFERHR